MTDVATRSAATASARTPLRPKVCCARAVGVIFSPRETYADIAAHPRVLGASSCWSCSSHRRPPTAFLFTEVGKNALFDQQIRTMESFGIRASTIRCTTAWSRQLQWAPYIDRRLHARDDSGRVGRRRRHHPGCVQRGHGRRRHLQAGLRHRRSLGVLMALQQLFVRAAQLRAAVDVEPDEPGGVLSVSRRDRRFWRCCSAGSISSSSG